MNKNEEFFLLNPYPSLIIPDLNLRQGLQISIVQCMDRLTNPPDLKTNPYWQREVGLSVLSFRQFVTGEFFRKFLWKEFPLWKMPRQWNKEFKKLIQLTAVLWGETWEMLVLFMFPIHPSGLFSLLVLENSLTTPIIPSKTLKKLPCTQIIKKMQAQNRELQSFKNPFKEEDEQKTKLIVDEIIQRAALNERFRKRYMQVVRTRMKLLTYLKSSEIEKISEVKGQKSKSERRGRLSCKSKFDRSS